MRAITSSTGRLAGEAVRPSLVQAVRRGDRIEVRLRFSEDDLTLIRAIPGRRWDPERRVWVLPPTDHTLATLAKAFGPRLIVARADEEKAAEPGHRGLDPEAPARTETARDAIPGDSLGRHTQAQGLGPCSRP